MTPKGQREQYYDQQDTSAPNGWHDQVFDDAKQPQNLSRSDALATTLDSEFVQRDRGFRTTGDENRCTDVPYPWNICTFCHCVVTRPVLARTALAFDDQDCLRHCGPRYHPESPERLEYLLNLIRERHFCCQFHKIPVR